MSMIERLRAIEAKLVWGMDDAPTSLARKQAMNDALELTRAILAESQAGEAVAWEYRITRVDDGSVHIDWSRTTREGYEANKVGQQGTTYRTEWRALGVITTPPAPSAADDVKCVQCGDSTMHMGNVCYACSHTTPTDPKADACRHDWVTDGVHPAMCVRCGKARDTTPTEDKGGAWPDDAAVERVWCVVRSYIQPAAREKVRAALIDALAAAAPQGVDVDVLDEDRERDIRAAIPAHDKAAHRALDSLLGDLAHQRDDNRRLYRTAAPQAPVGGEWVLVPRDLLTELADDLESEVRAHGVLPRRIERDLESVRRARELLSAAPPALTQPVDADFYVRNGQYLGVFDGDPVDASPKLVCFKKFYENSFIYSSTTPPTPVSTNEFRAHDAGGGDELCKHASTTPGWDFHTCNDCNAFKADTGWGLAKGHWFKSRSEAVLYRDTGRLPQPIPPSGEDAKWVDIPKFLRRGDDWT